MIQREEIVPGLPIICADDLIFGYVEGTEEHYLITTPMDDGQRHYLPLDLVDHVEDGVYLTLTRDELSQHL